MRNSLYRTIGALAFFCCLLLIVPNAKAQSRVQISLPDLIVQNIERDINFYDSSRIDIPLDTVMLSINGEAQKLIVRHGQAVAQYDFPQEENLTIIYDADAHTFPVNPLPLWTSILPPLLAIFMAFLIREVYSSLLVGVLLGASLIAYYQGVSAIWAVFVGLFRVFDTYVIATITDTGHAEIMVFLLLIGATVALVSLNGGMRGVTRWLSKYAENPRSGQIVTFIMDLCIFFDDYANTLVVGSTMRPLAKDLKISREKLAFIVDSTAAPVAALALITTWIGAALSYIQEGLDVAGITDNAYALFLASMPYRYYPILMLCFVLIIALSGRDYGPMHRAERLARQGISDENISHPASADSEIQPPPELRGAWYNAVVPIAVLTIMTIVGLFISGYSEEIWHGADRSFGSKLMDTVGAADSFVALLWASLSAMLVAMIMSVSQKIFSFKKSIEVMLTGFKIMIPAVLVLVFAWTLALITKHMHTAEFISRALIEWEVTPLWLPAMIFLMAAFIAFSTGTSWGTMAILYPLAIPVVWKLSHSAGMNHEEMMSLLLNVISCVFAGGVMGDHCSPISDTTIMSSSSTGCNHIEHVRTQMPYSLTVAAVSLFIGTIPATLGVPNWILIILGAILLWVVVRIFGKKTVDATPRTK